MVVVESMGALNVLVLVLPKSKSAGELMEISQALPTWDVAFAPLWVNDPLFGPAWQLGG